MRYTVPAPPLDADQEQLSDAMVAAWTAFAHAGEPDAAWPAFDGSAMESLVPPTPTVETGFAADHKCAFWLRPP